MRLLIYNHSNLVIMKKMTKTEMIEALQRCPRFKMEKRGAWEMLGIMHKDCVREYYDEYIGK